MSVAEALPHHTAIILDGNGRWASSRGLPRLAGHRAGATAVRRTVEAACEIGLPVLTLYAFSSDNWRRPATEVFGLFGLLREYLESETRRLRKHGVRLNVIGRRDRLDPAIVEAIEAAERATAAGRRLDLRLAIDYSARDAISRAAHRLSRRSPSPTAELANLLGGPDVDLLIRTGGERRLSDFLLWECAYAELAFLDIPWPEFARGDLESALADFAGRSRRFGGIGTTAGEKGV
ncbi:MAG TPA: polyprenyl diphosphate synthase [Candidatus Bathyarchaeia archaeon]|nr:polyprenyl diphosphate synthase [Candidatus Bathyarchaeia archaeon]